MSEVKFSKEHEWITVEGDVATIGITKHATEMLGDIVFAELPEQGSNVDKEFSKVDTKILLEVRGKKHPANICALPFYKKNYVKGVN